MPPDHEAVNASYCPVFTLGVLLAEREGMPIAGFMVNVDEYAELTVSDTASITMTLNCSGLFAASADVVEYVKVFDVDGTPVKSIFAITAPVMLLEISQLYVYGDVPPVIDAVQDTVCPTSSLALDGQFVRVGVVGAPAITVRVPDLTLLIVSGVEAESVMKTFAASVLETMFDGMIHAKELDVPATPVNSMFATRFPVTVFTIR